LAYRTLVLQILCSDLSSRFAKRMPTDDFEPETGRSFALRHSKCVQPFEIFYNKLMVIKRRFNFISQKGMRAARALAPFHIITLPS